MRAFGPEFYNRDDIPETELEPILPGNTLPGSLVALYDGRGRNETPIWIPEHRTIVFADALTAPEGDLLVWWTPWHQERALPALRALLELPFERVIVSHGKPVHDRKAYERVYFPRKNGHECVCFFEGSTELSSKQAFTIR